MHTLELAGVTSGYAGKQILHNITFKAQESAIYVVLGPNGAGKTTLFRTIAGILEPYSGHVLFDGEDLAQSKEARRKINYLSHYNAIPEEMTVHRALDFYAKIEGGDADEVITLLNLEELVDKKASDSISGAEEESLNREGLPQGEGSLPSRRTNVEPRPGGLPGDKRHPSEALEGQDSALFVAQPL